MNATISEIGIVSIIIKVALHLPRKNRTTRITKIPAYINVSVRLLIESFINDALSKSFSILTSGGRSFFNVTSELLNLLGDLNSITS